MRAWNRGYLTEGDRALPAPDGVTTLNVVGGFCMSYDWLGYGWRLANFYAKVNEFTGT